MKNPEDMAEYLAGCVLRMFLTFAQFQPPRSRIIKELLIRKKTTDTNGQSKLNDFFQHFGRGNLISEYPEYNYESQ